MCDWGGFEIFFTHILDYLNRDVLEVMQMAKPKTTTKMQIYVPPQIAEEIMKLAKRNDRPPGWIVAQAWRLVRDRPEKVLQPQT